MIKSAGTAILLLLCTTLLWPASVRCQSLKIAAPDDWRAETITLPPEFASDMKLKGIEELRFAPGMFQADSDTFFSYVFALQTAAEPQITAAVLKREMLAYYRGLAKAVAAGKDLELDVDQFSFALSDAHALENESNLPVGLQRSQGELSWVEPFVTGKQQLLQLEIDHWQDEASKHHYLFVCVAPRGASDQIWERMREIRASFHASRR